MITLVLLGLLDGAAFVGYVPPAAGVYPVNIKRRRVSR